MINETVLPTGLRVITASLAGFESASAAVFIRAGSRSEDDTNGGIAHFLEHMAFKGTETRTALQIAAEVEELGSQFNAFTSTDMTAYYVNGLGRHVPKSLAILGDVMTKSLFDPVEIDIEKGVILSEINRYLDSPTDVAYDGFGLIAYPGQALGRPILGTPEFIRSVNRNHFTDFVGQNYNTGSIVVVGTGDVEHEAFVALVAEHFAGIPQGVAPAFAPAVYGGGLSVNTSRPFEQVTALIGFDTLPVTDRRGISHALMASCLGGGMSSPLFQEVREKRGLVYSTSAYSAQSVDSGMLVMHAGTSPEQVEEFFKVGLGELATMTGKVQSSDLRRAKNRALVNLATKREKPFSLSQYLATTLFQHGVASVPQVEMADIEAVTEEDIREAAALAIKSVPTISVVGQAPDLDYMGLARSALS